MMIVHIMASGEDLCISVEDVLVGKEVKTARDFVSPVPLKRLWYLRKGQDSRSGRGVSACGVRNIRSTPSMAQDF
jgi:hypothetical protein